MSTGDVQNNIERLKRELKLGGYNFNIDWDSVRSGSVITILPILHSVIFSFYPNIARFVNEKRYIRLTGNDSQFVSGVYSFLSSELNYRPLLTQEQFLKSGAFVERKLIFMSDVCRLLRNFNENLNRVERSRCAVTRKSFTRHDVKSIVLKPENILHGMESSKIEKMQENPSALNHAITKESMLLPTSSPSIETAQIAMAIRDAIITVTSKFEILNSVFCDAVEKLDIKMSVLESQIKFFDANKKSPGAKERKVLRKESANCNNASNTLCQNDSVPSMDETKLFIQKIKERKNETMQLIEKYDLSRQSRLSSFELISGKENISQI